MGLKAARHALPHHNAKLASRPTNFFNKIAWTALNRFATIVQLIILVIVLVAQSITAYIRVTIVVSGAKILPVATVEWIILTVHIAQMAMGLIHHIYVHLVQMGNVRDVGIIKIGVINVIAQIVLELTAMEAANLVII